MEVSHNSYAPGSAWSEASGDDSMLEGLACRKGAPPMAEMPPGSSSLSSAPSGKGEAAARAAGSEGKGRSPIRKACWVRVS